jgi:hypothetical protein
VDSFHFSLHFGSVLSSKIFYFERFKAQFNPSVRTNWRLTVLNDEDNPITSEYSARYLVGFVILRKDYGVLKSYFIAPH